MSQAAYFDQELKLTAALYTKRKSVPDHVRTARTLPEVIPTGGSQIGMRLLIEAYGRDA